MSNLTRRRNARKHEQRSEDAMDYLYVPKRRKRGRDVEMIAYVWCVGWDRFARVDPDYQDPEWGR